MKPIHKEISDYFYKNLPKSFRKKVDYWVWDSVDHSNEYQVWHAVWSMLFVDDSAIDILEGEMNETT